MNEYSELEFKYKADDITLASFIDLMKDLPIVSKKDVSSWDHYYTSNNEDEFLRFRESTDPELTIKRKTTENNNWVRIEIDLPLDSSRIKTETVSNWVDLLGYKHKRSIYKTCFIYWTSEINFVYYIVYDTDMQEKGRFIEVEVNKYASNSNGVDPTHMLKCGQDVLLKLGLTPQNRLKKSLFEMFVK